jgi:hypothetical protein
MPIPGDAKQVQWNRESTVFHVPIKYPYKHVQPSMRLRNLPHWSCGIWRDVRIALDRRTREIPAARRPGKALIGWWGMIEGGAPTIGDFMAIANLARWLEHHGLPADVASAYSLPYEDLNVRRPQSIRIEDYGVFVFTCGPLVANRKILDRLRDFAYIPRVAVGVSVIPRQRAINRRFDRVVARDGTAHSTFDLSLANDVDGTPADTAANKSIALCLRGRQGEYGKSACLSARADRILQQAADRVGTATSHIDTVVRPDNSIEQIEAGFSNARIVLTTRLHGSLLALRAGVPFVAVDQIAGGAKLSAVLEKLEWPFVFPADSLDPATIEQAARDADSPQFRRHIGTFRSRAIRLSAEALQKSGRVVLSALAEDT